MSVHSNNLQQPTLRKSYIAIIIYTVIAVLFFFLFIKLDAPKQWFDKVDLYYQYRAEVNKKNVSKAKIMEHRLGMSYTLPMQVKDLIEKNGTKDPILLVEPNDYLQEVQKLPSRLPEPIIFYYYSGVKTAWMNSPYAKKATHLLKIQNNQFLILPIKDSLELKNIIDSYKNYETSL